MLVLLVVTDVWLHSFSELYMHIYTYISINIYTVMTLPLHSTVIMEIVIVSLISQALNFYIGQG